MQPTTLPPAPPVASPEPSLLVESSDNRGNAPMYSGGVRGGSTEGVEINIDDHGSKGDVGGGHFGGGGSGGRGQGYDGIVDEIVSSTKTILLTNWLNCLLIFVPLCFFARMAGAGDGAIFALAVLGIIPLAERLGFATEEVAGHTNETIGGLLNATFGNVTEMVISFFALAAGELRVVQLSLLGSIFTNTLLVLGMAFLAGGLRHKEQTFNKQGVALNAGLLLLSVFSLVLPATLQATNTNSNKDSLRISRISSVFLLVGYFAFLTFQLKTHRHLFAEEGGEDEDGDEDGDEEEGGGSKWEGVEEKGLLRQNESSTDVGGGDDDDGEGERGDLGARKGSFVSLSALAAKRATSVKLMATQRAADVKLMATQRAALMKRQLVRAKQKTNEYSNTLFGFAMIPEIEHDNEPLSLRMSVMWLAIITLFVALLSEALAGL